MSRAIDRQQAQMGFQLGMCEVLGNVNISLDLLSITSCASRAGSTKASGHISAVSGNGSRQPGRFKPTLHVLPEILEDDENNIVPAPVSLEFLSQVVICQHHRPLLIIVLPV